MRIEGHIEYIEEGTQLIVKEISNGECYNYIRKQLENKSEKFKIYDISLRKNSQEIQPNGIVKVSLPIPDFFDYNKLVVYADSAWGMPGKPYASDEPEGRCSYRDRKQ